VRDRPSVQQSGRVEPIKIRRHSPDLRCDVRRVAAYRATCGCGWKGPSRDRHADARADRLDHLAAAHGAGE